MSQSYIFSAYIVYVYAVHTVSVFQTPVKYASGRAGARELPEIMAEEYYFAQYIRESPRFVPTSCPLLRVMLGYLASIALYYEGYGHTRSLSDIPAAYLTIRKYGGILSLVYVTRANCRAKFYGSNPSRGLRKALCVRF